MRSNVIINKKYTQPVLDWMLHENNMEKYNTATSPNQGGQFYVITHINYKPEKLVEANFPFRDFFILHSKLLDIWDIPHDLPVDENYGHYLGIYKEGHCLPPHKDPNVGVGGPNQLKFEIVDDIYEVNDKIHCRFNIQIQKPKGGGNTIIEGKEIYVEENEPMLVLAGLYEHWVSKVEGDRDRLVCTFGHYLPIELAIEKGWYPPK